MSLHVCDGFRCCISPPPAVLLVIIENMDNMHGEKLKKKMYIRLMKVWWYVQKLKWGTYLQMPTLHHFLLLHH